MSEGITPENLINNIMDTLSDKHHSQSSGSLFEEKSHSVTAEFNKLFGRQKPVHHILGGGKSADVLLWRNKKISASVLCGATVVWVLFEWLNYHFLPLVCFGLVVCIIGQFIWSHVLNRAPPQIVLPDELFVNVSTKVGAEVNRVIGFLQRAGSGGDIKQLGIVVGSLLTAAIIGTWCNFWTVIYLGFVAAHILPVVYEKYDDQIYKAAYNVLGKLQNNYSKLDASVLSRIPARKKFA
ncbi:reticulon-like protein B8 [Bidens hawaiensis]|uniref:reticulon-like protein B8 n=1 Tax=Bidens hawaiensis TaxID=980011 RepID=UPI004049E5FE